MSEPDAPPFPLLLLHAALRWIGWTRWWLYALFGFAIGIGVAALWPVGGVSANAHVLAPLGAGAALYFWSVLYGPRLLRWCVLAALLPLLAVPLVLLGHWIARTLAS